MTPELRKALETFAIRFGFAAQALDGVLAALRKSEVTEMPKNPRHPLCVAMRCGEVDCGRPGPCYVQVGAWPTAQEGT